MSRNINGTYTLPAGNPVAPNTVIDTGWANPTMSDIGAALTDSLSRTGLGGMLAPFLNADGTQANAGISWTNEPTSGWYRSATNTFIYSVAGVNIFQINLAGISLLTGKKFSNFVASGPALFEGPVTFQSQVTLANLVADTIVVGDGTVGAPSIRFQDINTGWFQPSADVISTTINGVVVETVNSTGLSVVGALSATGNLTLSGADSRILGGNTSGRLFLSNSDLTTFIALNGASSGLGNPYEINIAVNGVARAQFTTTGLAVNGALTPSGILTVGTTNKWYSSELAGFSWWTTATAGGGAGIASAGTDLILRAAGANVATASATGVSINGALSATKNLVFSGAFLGSASDYWIGRNGSDTIYNVPTGSTHVLAVNNANAAVISSTGVSVNGALSATGLSTFQNSSSDVSLKIERTTTVAGSGYIGCNGTDSFKVSNGALTSVGQLRVTQDAPVNCGVFTAAGLTVSGSISCTGLLRSTEASGWAVGGSVGGIPRIQFSSNTFTALNASDSAAAFSVGAFSKTSGTFRFPDLNNPETHDLVHSFVEGAQPDLIYRGKVTVENGFATVDMDESIGLTAGTFEKLNKNIQVWVANNGEGWARVKGKVADGVLRIWSDTDSATEVDWLVIGQRNDPVIKAADWTDDEGNTILQPLRKVAE